ncbi:hypothetical protein BBF96_13105 [Anoxybacter fermentans]|uniref:Transposase IS4-like domain-containing protein n=1 Tax=Anoxybacter fermentans TaxID=1323375 RepID=A0A3S9T178_9FIRM|nr:hypothetical protein [Anoxybacter fermentans]AZR74255.1 hypothetical protein BBF96_13105 [Anoxybacter fermentans]
MYVAVDYVSEFPIVLILSQASKVDGEFTIPLVYEIYRRCKEKGYKVPKNWVVDSGYDWLNIYQEIYQIYKGQVFILINKRNASQLPEGYYDFDRIPV